MVSSFFAVGSVAANPTDPLLVSAEEYNFTSLQSFKSLASGFGQKSLAPLLRFGVRSYKLNYKTNYNGRQIEASGLMFIPEGATGELPMISLQHGTTFLKDEVPSMSGGFTGMEFFASGGFVTLMPDYIGYGSSSSIFHPYYTKDHSAGAVVDMIKAAREYLKQHKVAHSERVFLAGYSEGGYVTMAAAEEIEKNKDHGITLSAVAAGAGGYDLGEMLRQVSTSAYYSYPSYLAFVLMSYNTTYNWKKDLSYFFRRDYAAVLEKHMNGEHDGWEINRKLTTDVRSFFNPVFYAGLNENGGEAQLKSAIGKNTINAWRTEVPIRFYHGTNDEIIPLSNTEATLEKFRNAGATNVSLKKIPGGSHGSSFAPMAKDFIPWFTQLAGLQQ